MSENESFTKNNEIIKFMESPAYGSRQSFTSLQCDYLDHKVDSLLDTSGNILVKEKNSTNKKDSVTSSHEEDCGRYIESKESLEEESQIYKAKEMDNNLVEKNIPNISMFGSSFIHGITNKSGPTFTAPWMSKANPLPPFESLMPPNINVHSNAATCGKINISLKNSNITNVMHTDPNCKAQFEKNESNFCSMNKNQGSKRLAEGSTVLYKRKVKKTDLYDRKNEKSLLGSLSSDSSSSEEGIGHEKYNSKDSYKLTHKKMIPKYGETRPDTPINYEALRESLPRTQSSHKYKINPEDRSEQRLIDYDSYEKYKYRNPKNISSDSNLKMNLPHGIDTGEQVYQDREFVCSTKLSKSANYRKRGDRYLSRKNNEKSYFKKSSTQNYHEMYSDEYEKCYSSKSSHNRNSKKRKGSKYYKTNSEEESDTGRLHDINNYEVTKSKNYANVDKYKHHSKIYYYESDSGSNRESGECSSTASESNTEELKQVDDMSTDAEIEPAHVSAKKSIEKLSHDNCDVYSRRESPTTSQVHNIHIDSDYNSPSSNSSKSSGKTAPLHKRLGIAIEKTNNNDSSSSYELKNNEATTRKGPHTPDYPYEKSPTDSCDDARSVRPFSRESNEKIDIRGIGHTSVITKSNNSIKGSSCNYTINHYKPASSGDKAKVVIERFRLSQHEPNIEPIVGENSSKIFKSSGSTSIKESPVRTNLDARIKTMFGIKNSSSEDSPVKVDSSQKSRLLKPLNETPSPFRSRNTYLHWYKETHLFKKLIDTHSIPYADPNKKTKIGIQIKKYSEDSSSDEERPTESLCTLQELGISPPTCDRVQQIKNFDKYSTVNQKNYLHSKLLDNNIVKMVMSPNSELELNLSSNNKSQQADDYFKMEVKSYQLMDLVVTKLLSDLKTSIKGEITDDVINCALHNETSNSSTKTTQN